MAVSEAAAITYKDSCGAKPPHNTLATTKKLVKWGAKALKEQTVRIGKNNKSQPSPDLRRRSALNVSYS
jgi:hypothetical protein